MRTVALTILIGLACPIMMPDAKALAAEAEKKAKAKKENDVKA